jgi:hypothetical protein
MRRRRLNRPWSSPGLTLLCCIAAASGCDSRQLLAPTARTAGPAGRDASSESAVLGMAMVAPEQTAGVPLAPAPESTWVVIQVGGQYDAKVNPGCSAQPPNWPCIFNAPASNFFDQRPFTSGPVQAWVVSTRTSQVQLRGTGGAVNTAGQAIGLYYGAAPGQLLVLSALQNFGTQNPNPVGQISSWIFSGQYSATATRISNPLTFTGGPTGDPQGTASFTVGTTAPLQFINPPGVNGPAPNVDWYFVPGDSVPLEYERSSQAWQVFSCFQRITCNVTPPPGLNGRMQVVAYVEGRLVIGRSDYVRGGQEPKLSLSCNGHTDSVSVVRTESVTCVALAQPTGAQLRVTSWTFEGGGQTISRDPASTQEAQWRGMMVVSGKISVTGTVNGSASSASAVVTVMDRRWPEAPPRVSERQDGCAAPGVDAGCILKYPPDTVSHLGKTQSFSHHAPLRSRAAHVEVGPNAGFSYVGGAGSPYVHDSIVVHLNRALFDDDAALWRRQKECTRVQLLDFTRAHEGMHVRFMLEGIAAGVANTYPIEPQVYFGSLAEMGTRLERMEGDVSGFIAILGDHDHLRQEWSTLVEPCHILDILSPSTL